ncbi:biotin--[acetyl-CoA-carboxylase] ligase [Microbacterium betulae]|uniref:biotin--[biotin carboxyl-carrier protein] ligase n=1 Tax=Microbacterium betulae TaxID=2981139 RepID=A0AA97FJ15_9MICO|nr:biotin--[acetyl-CoA-carboxylase] ligase [Microbacterium sp. AB]WOF24158.1 biotin--[acetyl-CoA-carboxylase] ligase [Microbacterium sp. AB]
MDWERTRAASGRVIELARTGSTNADLVRAIGAGEEWPHLGVLLTRDQTAGRGRLDRRWVAPPGSALAVSVVVQVPRLPAAARGWIPLVAGVAMRQAIAAQADGHEAGLKWPNDVLVRDDEGTARKICGVLAEATAAPDAVVIGTGVNTRLEPGDLPVPTATSFPALGIVCDEDALVATYLSELDRLLVALASADGDAVASGVHREASAMCLTLGREVSVSLPDGSALRGRAASLAPDGRLVVESADGPVAVSAGDVVHVR